MAAHPKPEENDHGTVKNIEDRSAAEEIAPDLLHVSAAVELKRRGVEARLIIGEAAPCPDPVHLRTLQDAHQWVKELRTGTPLATIAKRSGHHEPFIRTRAPLAFLSPIIQVAIRDGTQPQDLTLNRILTKPIPLDWEVQEKMYGFAERYLSRRYMAPEGL